MGARCNDCHGPCAYREGYAICGNCREERRKKYLSRRNFREHDNRERRTGQYYGEHEW